MDYKNKKSTKVSIKILDQSINNQDGDRWFFLTFKKWLEII